MGHLIIPTEQKVAGPWLIDSVALESLHDAITLIDAKLDEAFSIHVEQYTDQRIEDGSLRAREVLKETVLKSYDRHRQKVVTVSGKNGEKIQDETLISLLKDRKLESFKPEELSIQITKGPCEFQFELSSKYSGALQTRAKVDDDNILSDINYELSKWIEKHKASRPIQAWSSLFPLITFPLIIVFTFVSAFLFTGRSTMYKSVLKHRSHELLKDSLSDDEMIQAVQILLEDASGYVPDNFYLNRSFDSPMTIVFIFLLAVLILNIKPKTVIGLGRNKGKVDFYRSWIYFVMFFIPFSIVLPVLLSKLFG